ncbi:MAG: hypothetical protein ABIK68_20885 [bacterium]
MQFTEITMFFSGMKIDIIPAIQSVRSEKQPAVTVVVAFSVQFDTLLDLILKTLWLPPEIPKSSHIVSGISRPLILPGFTITESPGMRLSGKRDF